MTDLDHAAALDALDTGYQKGTDAVTAPAPGAGRAPRPQMIEAVLATQEAR
ncbi:MAG: hypothetical protein ACLP5E_21045 [Streptosporangiaceae bacterium]